MELAGGGPAAGIDSPAFLQPDLCETDHDPAEQAQRKGRLGLVDPAVIFTWLGRRTDAPFQFTPLNNPPASVR